MRLTAICIGSKQTISTSRGLRMLQMVELDTGWCASEDVGLSRGWIVDCGLLDPTSVGEGNETFLIRVLNLSLVYAF